MRAARAAVAVLLALASPALAAPELAAVFGDHMVLQRDRPIPVWGRAAPGAEVAVAFAGATKKTAAGGDGRFRVDLDPVEAGGPHELTVTSGGETAAVRDVLVGEVWICSGQSNMAFPLRSARDGADEVRDADHPRIRLLTVPRRAAGEPQADFEGGAWAPCSPETAGAFSAVGYFFGREIHERIDVPVGLVNTSYGGTPAESWTRRSALDAEESLAPLLAQWDERVAAFDPDEARADHARRLAVWRRAAAAARARGRRPPPRPRLVDPRMSPHRPAGLWNAMVAPIVPFAVRGAIWYQGESNAARAFQYRAIFPAMIRDWRAAWGQGDFPFYYVQLANFRPRAAAPGDSAWAELREVQRLTLGAVPNTGMAVTIDIGEARDIHPRNKQDVGLRLALWALARDYGKQVECSGPLYAGCERRGSRIVVRFEHASGLRAGGDDPRGFTIAGADRVFRRAEARIRGRTVEVSHPDLPEPVAVRYGWADNPDCDLVNRAGLPASPFRTDDWPFTTAPK